MNPLKFYLLIGKLGDCAKIHEGGRGIMHDDSKI